MTDYQTLYKQSLLQIQKQKDQIKKLEEQIRQRCQSYLIHSSRYKSTRRGDEQGGSQTKKNGSQSGNDSQSAAQPVQAQFQFVSNAINMTFQSHAEREKGVNESTQANNKVQNDDQGEMKSKSSMRSQNGTEIETKKVQKQPSLQNLKSLESNDSFVSEGSSLQHSQQKILEKQNTQPQVNWQQVVSGLKQRMSQIQRQKSDQAQKIIDLQQQIRIYQKELINASSSMKKKPTKSVQYENISNEQTGSAGEQLKKLFQNLQNDLNLSQKQTNQDKIREISKYIAELKAKVTYFEQNYMNGQMDSSKVQQYHYNTPYRKIKEKQNEQEDQVQKRDHYQQNQLQILRNKCKQLQMELTKSREQKFCTPGRNGSEQEQIGQEIMNQGPYLIQEELQKPNSPYVKRSFVRKKVVKRNLSAMILRSPSKSKSQSKAAMLSQLQKLKNHLQKSKDGKNEKQVSSLSKKIEKIQRSIELKQQKIDEISDQDSSVARTSGVSQGGFTQIIQIETEGPGFKNYTARIQGLSRKDRSTHAKKKEKNNS